MAVKRKVAIYCQGCGEVFEGRPEMIGRECPTYPGYLMVEHDEDPTAGFIYPQDR